jgi:hypothetical protein
MRNGGNMGIYQQHFMDFPVRKVRLFFRSAKWIPSRGNFFL